MKINLFSSYYQVSDPERQAEIDFCRKANNGNKFIDAIYYFEAGRPTYADFFSWMREFPNDINILANSDIYFDETLELVKSIDVRTCYALTRWEEREEGIVPFEKGHTHNGAKAKQSQDVWVFLGEPRIKDGNFCLGQPGCDNKIAYLIRLNGYQVTNPSLSIRAIHRHKEDARTYNLPRLGGPFFWPIQTEL
jgi:hypothetical protein